MENSIREEFYYIASALTYSRSWSDGTVEIPEDKIVWFGTDDGYFRCRTDKKQAQKYNNLDYMKSQTDYWIKDDNKHYRLKPESLVIYRVSIRITTVVIEDIV